MTTETSPSSTNTMGPKNYFERYQGVILNASHMRTSLLISPREVSHHRTLNVLTTSFSRRRSDVRTCNDHPRADDERLSQKAMSNLTSRTVSTGRGEVPQLRHSSHAVNNWHPCRQKMRPPRESELWKLTWLVSCQDLRPFLYMSCEVRCSQSSYGHSNAY